MNRVAEALDQQYPKWGPGRRARVITLHDHLVGRARAWMLMLLGAVGLLLLIACANVANLMLARAPAARAKSAFAPRLAPAAWRNDAGPAGRRCRARLIGGVLGVLLAYAGVQLIGLAAGGLPRVADIAINMRVLAAAIAAAITTGVFFGIVPAIHASRADVSTVLKEGGRSATAGSVGHRCEQHPRRRRSGDRRRPAGWCRTVRRQLRPVDSHRSGIRLRQPADLQRRTLRTPPRTAPDAGRSRQTRSAASVFSHQMLEAVSTVPGVEGPSRWSRRASADRQLEPNQRQSLPGQARGLEGDDDSIDQQTVTPDYFADCCGSRCGADALWTRPIARARNRWW